MGAILEASVCGSVRPTWLVRLVWEVSLTFVVSVTILYFFK